MPPNDPDDCELGITVIDTKKALEGDWSPRKATQQYCLESLRYVKRDFRHFMFDKVYQCHIVADGSEMLDVIRELVELLAGQNIIFAAHNINKYVGKGWGLAAAGFNFPPNAL